MRVSDVVSEVTMNMAMRWSAGTEARDGWVPAMVIPGSLVVLIVLVFVCCKLKRRYKKTKAKFAKTCSGKGEPCDLADLLNERQRRGAGRPCTTITTLKQISVNSATGLLLQRKEEEEEEVEDITLGEGEGQENPVGGALDPGSPRGRGEPQVFSPPQGPPPLSRHKRASTPGSDSGVELRNSGGDPEEVNAAKGSNKNDGGDDVEEGAEPDPERGAWPGRTRKVSGALRTAYVSRDSPGVSTSAAPGREAWPSCSHVTEEGGACQDAAGAAPRARSAGGGACLVRSDRDGRGSSARPELGPGDRSSSQAAVWVESGTAADLAPARPGHLRAGGGTVMPAAAGQTSSYVPPGVPYTEASLFENAFRTTSPVHSDADDDELQVPEVFLPPLADGRFPYSQDLSLTPKWSLSHPGTWSPREACLEASSKDSGGLVQISAHPLSLSPPGLPFSPLLRLGSNSQDEAISVSGLSLSTDSLSEQGQTSGSVLPDSAARTEASSHYMCVSSEPGGGMNGYSTSLRSRPGGGVNGYSTVVEGPPAVQDPG